MRKFYSFILLLFSVGSGKVWATAQAPGILIYKGDTLDIYANPLEDFYTTDRPDFFGIQGYESTDCWRGYQAE
ncbi:hypothetical protein QNI19_07290 [Cytophagaceae bacterium DM2B3-1]|uniref:Uncharacterized protein n=1 Tax=Xanthocytophaga flava TaxID=3048013 RepID=A0ABT7CG89_9BACT|nr:hypothetical protein [Xanthocytophaga flavus]MDJ1492730.1 hypothetical protein [Xanthocytophaga flavus]